MGNYISCNLLGPAGRDSGEVIFPGGEIRRFREPMKAAELMIEVPNSFLVNAAALQVGRRFSPLSAEEDLETGNVYTFFPMKRLNSVVVAADLGVLFLAARRVSNGSVRVSPEWGVDPGNGICPAAKLNLDDIEEYSTPEFRHRAAMWRSKTPVLETIVEEHLSLRFMMMMEN